jgi:histidine phosphotransfer protein HptB
MAIDKAALDRLLAIVGDEDGVAEVVSEFLAEGPLLVEALLASAKAGDLQRIRRSAHTIKSNARDMGAVELANLCDRIEAASAQGSAPADSDIESARQAISVAFVELRLIYNL